MTIPTDLRTTKSLARRSAEARRAVTWAAWRQRHDRGAGKALATHLEPLLALASVAGLGGTRGPASAYLPMRTEIDPLPLLAAFADAGWSTCLPVVTSRDVPLAFRTWAPGNLTVSARFGTREPPPDHPLSTPRLLLVPLLAFDAGGWRLGYGGGYYDRTLRQLRAAGPVLAAGVAFDEQEVDAVPHLDYDERLDAIVTPAGVHRIIG